MKFVSRLLAPMVLVCALACGQQQAGKTANLDVEAEIVKLKKKLETAPQSSSLHEQLAVLLSAKGDSEGSDREMSIAMQLDPHDPLLRIEASASYHARKLHEKEAEMLNQAVAVDRQNPLSHFFLGAMYERRSDSEKAMAEYREAKRLIDTLSERSDASPPQNRIVRGDNGDIFYVDQFGKNYSLSAVISRLRKKLAK